MLFIVVINVVASRPPERRPIGTQTTRANSYLLKRVRFEYFTILTNIRKLQYLEHKFCYCCFVTNIIWHSKFYSIRYAVSTIVLCVYNRRGNLTFCRHKDQITEYGWQCCRSDMEILRQLGTRFSDEQLDFEVSPEVWSD